MIRILRNILKIPINVLYGLIIFYNKLVKKIDPNSLENYLEELFQKKIDEKIGSDIKFKDNYFHDLSEYKSKFYNYNQPLKFYTPTKIASHRVSSLFLKEPYTIEWIEKNGGDNIPFIDIGANIGLYSIYYAHIFDAKVYSFEPSFRNLDLLARNVKLNLLQKKVSLIPNPISKKFIFSNFFQLEPLAGHSAATFNDEIVKNSFINENNRNKKNNTTEYMTLGLSIDNESSYRGFKSDFIFIRNDNKTPFSLLKRNHSRAEGLSSYHTRALDDKLESLLNNSSLIGSTAAAFRDGYIMQLNALGLPITKIMALTGFKTRNSVKKKIERLSCSVDEASSLILDRINQCKNIE